MNSGRKPPRFPLAIDESHPLETLALWALAALVAVAACLWLTGELSGRIFGGSWPQVSSSDMGGVITRFPRHASDPAAAWTRPQRSLMPGAFVCYAMLAAVLAPFATASLLVLRRSSRSRRASGGGARWALPSDLQPLHVDDPQQGRLTLGRVEGRLVAAQPRQSVIVVGPVQTGKTSGF